MTVAKLGSSQPHDRGERHPTMPPAARAARAEALESGHWDCACHTAAMGRPETIDEYLAAFTGEGRELLGQLRAVARETVPEASEAIKWGSPAWVHPSGTILFMISGHAEHAGVAFTPTTREAFVADLEDFATGKGPSSSRTTSPCRSTWCAR
jgi:uncharacterized protein YdhG (YjbR/CyaY superfamily)